MADPRRIRVVTLITRLDLGGAQQVALHAAASLDPQRFESMVLCGRGGRLDSMAAEDSRYQLHFLRFLKHPISPLRDLLALIELWLFLVTR